MSLLKRVQAARTAQTAAAPAVAKVTRATIVQQALSGSNREERFEALFGKRPVQNSPDMERILALPRRPVPDEAELERLQAVMTARLTNGVKAGDGCRCAELGSPCITALRPHQAWYLYEAEQTGGCAGALAVGSGKTGLDILTAMVVPGCRAAALLLPSQLKRQFMADFTIWAQHFKVPNIAGGPGAGRHGEYVTDGRPVLHVLKYSELSAPRFSTWFIERPEITVVICDESHNLKDRNAVRTDRFLKTFEGRDVRLFFHTGSITSKAIQEYTHLMALSLGDGSPVPINPHTVNEWGDALNPPKGQGMAAPPGALMRLCANGEKLYRGFARRLMETRGYVATFEDSAAGVDLKVTERVPPPMPAEVKAALKEVREEMRRPDGEELTEALEVARAAREVACGYFNHWVYPGAKEEDFVPGGRIDQWFGTRQAWNREVREELKFRRPNLDSPGLLKSAAKRAAASAKGTPKEPIWHSETWEAWAGVEKTVPHDTRVKWVSDWLARDAVEWGKRNVGIIWVESPAMGALIAKLGGFVYHGAGPDADDSIRAAGKLGTDTIVASIKAHSEGKNLQAYCHNLVVQAPSDAKTWEQLIGRTLRYGQKADLVTVEVYLHAAELVEGFAVATRRAEYAEGTTMNKQKLLRGLNPLSRQADSTWA